MSSAKAALESDTRVLAYEAGRKFQIRVNTISAGPLGSRAAKAIGFIEDMIRFDSYHFVIFSLLIAYCHDQVSICMQQNSLLRTSVYTWCMHHALTSL